MRRFLALAGAVFLFDAYFLQHDETSNARTRLALAKAIVLERRLAIDSFHLTTRDKAYFQDHYYCDKAPLASFLAVPPLWACVALGVDDEATLAYVTRLLTVSLATALALPLFAAVLRRIGVSESAALWTCAAGWLGTALLPYGTVFFGHNLTFALVVAALAFRAAPFAHGLCLGLAVMSDYQALPLAGLLIGWPLLRRRIGPSLLAAAGATGPLLGLGAYHHALFGSPFTLPVRYEVFAPVHAMAIEYSQGFYGMRLPSPAALYLLLFSPGKGLITLSPFLLVIPFAARRVPASAREILVLSAVVIPIFILIIASIPSYHGGFSFGPRLLIPVLPFVLFWLGVALDSLPARLRAVFRLALGWSFLNYAGASATLIAVPYDLAWPLGQIVIPWLLTGQLARNAGELFGLPGAFRLLPLALVLAILLGYGLRGTIAHERHDAAPRPVRLKRKHYTR